MRHHVFPAAVLVLLLSGCVSRTVEPDLATEVPYLTPIAKRELDDARTWLREHELRILAEEIEVRVPDDLYEISAFFVKPEFFEETRRRQVEMRDGKPCPLMVTEIRARTEAIQVARFTLRGTEEVRADPHGLEVAALRHLRVIADPSLSTVTVEARGAVSWKLDGDTARSGARTFRIPPGALSGHPVP